MPIKPDQPNEPEPVSSAAEAMGRRMFAFHAPIRTNTAGVTWSGILLMSFPWFCVLFHVFVAGTAITYTIKHYTNDPQIITGVLSIAGIVGLFIGPIVSFLSDRIWTRIGRRKPFILITWMSAAIGLALIPLVPVIGPALNSVLQPFGVPYIKDFFLLATIIVSYGILGSFQGPLEPLCLEVVPAAQRGRYWAMRNILGNLACIYFFQILWPYYDVSVPLISTAWLHVELTGEQMIYVMASGLFAINSIYLMVNIKETRIPTAENLKFREIKVWPFVKAFILDVFGDKRWYPLYIIIVIPGIAAAVWGTMNNVMQTDQFGYSKPNMAMMGLPPMVLSMLFITPFAGWYSDRKPSIKGPLMALLILVGFGTLGAMFWIYQGLVLPNKLELPSLEMCFLLTGLIAVSTICFFVVIIELVLKFANRDDMRAWIATLAIVKDIVFTLFMYLLINKGSEGGVPSITLWMVVGQLSGTSGALINVVVGPMIFEYIPSNRFGTVAAGSGILGGIMTAITANLGSWWIKYYTFHLSPDHAQAVLDQAAGLVVKYDYTCLYLLQLGIVPISLAAQVFFLYLVIKGKLIPYGRMKDSNAAA
ncbi:MAG: MFS transporter [Verrucomicrobiota bacterium]|nr:MFS transporter [Verrucomicrobiota bacterium]